jgi:hypothetical protein
MRQPPSISPDPSSEVKVHFDFRLGPASAFELGSGDFSNQDSRVAANLHVLRLITGGLADQGIPIEEILKSQLKVVDMRRSTQK